MQDRGAVASQVVIQPLEQRLGVLRVPQAERGLPVTGQHHPAPAAGRGGPSLGKVEPAAACSGSLCRAAEGVLLCAIFLDTHNSIMAKGTCSRTAGNTEDGRVSPAQSALRSVPVCRSTHLGRWGGNMMHRHDQLLLLGSAGHGSN